MADETNSNVRPSRRKAWCSTSAADVVQRGQMMARAIFKYLRREIGRYKLLHTAVSVRDATARRYYWDTLRMNDGSQWILRVWSEIYIYIYTPSKVRE